LKNFEIILVSMLNALSLVDRKNPSYVAASFAKLVLSDERYLNMKVPTQYYLQKVTLLTELVIHQSWDILIKVYGLIVTKKGVGTFVVAALPAEQYKKILELIDIQFNGASVIVFDRLGLRVLNYTLQNQISRAFDRAYDLPESQSHQGMHKALLTAITKVTSERCGYTYQSQEIYFAREYKLLLLMICKVFLRGDSSFVLYKPATLVMLPIVEKSNRTVIVVGAIEEVDPLEELETICKTKKVGIVCFSLSPFCPDELEARQLAWNSLLVLQLKYKFIILIDDRFPGRSEVPDIWSDQLFKQNKAIIYLRPLTLVERRLQDIEVMAAPRQFKLRLKRSVWAEANQIPILIANALLSLLKDGNLLKAEQDSFVQQTKFISTAKKEISESGLFNISALQRHCLWFIYLEPKTGDLTPDVYQRLKHMNIYVMDPAVYSVSPYNNRGIWISISAYNDASRLLRDIKKLISALKKMII
jgi:hypothetical protein